MTCGAEGIQLEGEGQDSTWIDSIPAPAVVDQTGAGDAFVGTLTARMVLGDSLPVAARYGAAAASLVVGGKGGTGFIPTLEQTRAHAGNCRLRPGPAKECSHHTPKRSLRSPPTAPTSHCWLPARSGPELSTSAWVPSPAPTPRCSPKKPCSPPVHLTGGSWG